MDSLFYNDYLIVIPFFISKEYYGRQFICMEIARVSLPSKSNCEFWIFGTALSVFIHMFLI